MLEDNPFSARQWAESLPEMIEEIRSLDRLTALSFAAGLQLLPKFAHNAVRIEALVQLVLQFANGDRIPRASDIARLLNYWMMGASLASLEDPAEDVFISNVISEIGNTRVFEGIWESNDFSTQLLFQANYLTAKDARNRELALWPFPLMVLSEALADRANLKRFTLPDGTPKARMDLPDDNVLKEISQHCCFSWEDLDKLGLKRSDIEEYLFTSDDIARDFNNGFDDSIVHEHPLIETETGVLVMIPPSLMKALRVSIIRKVQRLDLNASFYRHLLDQQANAAREAFERMGAFSIDFENEELGPPQLESCRMQTRWFRFDRSWFALAIIITVPENSLLEAVQSQSLVIAKKDEEILALWEKEALEAVSRVPGFRGGLVFHIVNSLGAGMMMATPVCESEKNWRDWNLPLADLRILSCSADIDIIRLMTLALIRDDFGERDMRWVSANGDFNFISWALSVEFRLVPKDWSATRLNVVIPDDAMFVLRKRTRSRIDEHGVLFLHRIDTENGTKLMPATLTVERHQPWSYFDDSRELSAYVCPDDARGRRLRAAIECQSCTIWIEMDRCSHEESLVGVFHLWQALVTWFERLFEAVCRDVLAHPLPALISLQFAVEEPFVFNDDVASDGTFIDVIGKSSHTIVFGVSRRMLRQFQSETNLAEKQLITAVFQALMDSYGKPQASLLELIDKGFRGGAAKSMHVAFRSDVRAMLKSLVQRGRPAKICSAIKESLRIGLAHRICPFINSGTYKGSSAQWILNTAAVRIRALIKVRLSSLNRRSLVLRIFENIENIEADNWQWQLSSSALLDLHGGLETVDSAMREHVSTNEGTLLASKIIIEMSLCDSPATGGHVATDLDLRWLTTQALLLIEFGYQSDALYTRLAESDHVTIHVNGDIESDSGYWNETVVPFRQNVFRTRLKGDAASYASMIGVKSESELMPDRNIFLAAFHSEVGVGLENAFTIVQGLGLLALSNRELVIDSTQEELLSKIVAVSGVSLTEVEAFFEYFSLNARPAYEVPTVGFVGHDIHPWRFSRRLSLVRRPILRWREGEVHRVMVSPAIAEQSLGHFMVKFSRGEYEPYFFNTNCAKAWIGKATKREGDEFEDQVAAEFVKAGFVVKQRIFMRQLGGSKELGEIDVIAFDLKSRVIWIIECKNLREARTIKEIAEQLNKCTGLAEVKDDIVYKHIRRMDWLNGQRAAVARLLNITEPFVLSDCIVTSRIVPMRFRDRSIYPQNHWVAYADLRSFIDDVRKSC